MNTTGHRLTEAGHRARTMLEDLGRAHGNAAYEVALLALARAGTTFTILLLAAEVVRLTDYVALDTGSVDVVG